MNEKTQRESGRPDRPNRPPMDPDKIFHSNSDDYTREFYDSLLIVPSYVGSDLSSTKVEYFGRTYNSPIMIAPVSLGMGGPGNGPIEMAQAAKATGTLFWGTHLNEEETSAIVGAGVDLVTCSKPLADHEALRGRIRKAEEAGAAAFFIDIDHLFTKDGGWDNFANRGGEPDAMGGSAGTQTLEDLRSYVECSSLPIIIKGVLSVHDALLCKEAGVAAIVASHHHGQVLYSIPPALAAEQMRAALGEEYPIFVDCGIRSGIDAFKALALGADGVLVGRQLLPAFSTGGSEAVVRKLEEMTAELRQYMNLTGSRDVRHIRSSSLYRKNF